MDAELDVARLVAINVTPKLEQRLDNICREVVNLFKHGKLGEGKAAELYADYRATQRLLSEVKQGGR